MSSGCSPRMSQTSKVIFNTCNLLSELWKVPRVSQLGAYEPHALVNTRRLPVFVEDERSVFVCVFEALPAQQAAVPSLITAHTLSSSPFRSNNFVVCIGFYCFPKDSTWYECACMFMRSHVHYSRRNAQLLYLSISQGSIGVLVFFHHITVGVGVWGGGEGEGKGVGSWCLGCLQPSTENLHSLFSPILHFGFVCCPSRRSAAPPRRGKQREEWYWDIKL